MKIGPYISYYGGKTRLAAHYPPPRYGTIIEPFAGGAGYASRYADRRVILIEKNPIIVGIWRLLIRSSPADVLRFPLLEPGQKINELKASQEVRWLLGFWVSNGQSVPKQSLTVWGREKYKISAGFWGEKCRARLAGQVDRIKHWQVYEDSYENIKPAGPATWFVDPPYQAAGAHYPCGPAQIDYAHLGAWCRALPGQAIVCENAGATWLPFRPFRDAHSAVRGQGTQYNAKGRSAEMMWTNGTIS